MSSDQSPPPQLSSATRPRRSRTPPRWLWIVLALIGVAVMIVRETDLFGDHAFSNVTTVVLGFVAVLLLAAWFLFLSGYRRRTRLLVGVGCLAVVSLLAWLFRIDRVNGELMPVFALRFSTAPDRLLATPAAGDGEAHVDLHTTTDDDFPGFLGPYRNEAVDNVRLDPDWEAHPPKLIWRQKIGAGWSAFAVVNGHAVTMEQRGDEEMTTCYAVDTGRLEWSHSTPGRFEKLEAGVGPRSTPTIDEGMVYALGAYGRLTCLDGANGKPVWEKDLLKEYGISREDERATVPWGRSASPLVVGGRVIVPVGGRKGGRLVSLVALDKQSGKVLWEGGQKQISYCSPSLANIGGIEQVLIVNEDTVAGHQLETGKQLWESSRPGRTNRDPNVSQAVPVGPNLVFTSKGYGGGAIVLRLDREADGTLVPHGVWEDHHVMRTKFTNVAVQGNCAYGLSDGVLECIDLGSGVRKWKNGRYGHGQILHVGDLLLVLSEEGEVVLVEATPERADNVQGRLQAIEGITWNNLALYGPYLLVRNSDEAACYKLPLATQR